MDGKARWTGKTYFEDSTDNRHSDEWTDEVKRKNALVAAIDDSLKTEQYAMLEIAGPKIG